MYVPEKEKDKRIMKNFTDELKEQDELKENNT